MLCSRWHFGCWFFFVYVCFPLAFKMRILIQLIPNYPQVCRHSPYTSRDSTLSPDAVRHGGHPFLVCQ